MYTYKAHFSCLETTNKPVFDVLYFNIHHQWKNIDSPELKIKRQGAKETEGVQKEVQKQPSRVF